MRVTLLHNDGRVSYKEIDTTQSLSEKKSFTIPSATDKIEQITEIMGALNTGNIPLLFDASMHSTRTRGESLALCNPNEHDLLHDAAALFFTSGTSGNPIGVIKTMEHLRCEVDAHTKWLSLETFEQCLVSVPLFHIYGFLFGILVPDALKVEIVTKEDFLPHEIVNICASKPTLCITNPVFIRAMLRLREDVNLSNTLFICSSGPLDPSEAAAFEEKYTTRLTQLYGSSETGGIAIRSGGSSIWTPLEGVSVLSDDEGILSVNSSFVSQMVYDNDFKTIASPFKTTDIVVMSDEKFEIVGRCSELVKLGGKRLSILEIELFLEGLNGIDEALGFVEYHPEKLRGESLSLYLVGDEAKIDKTIVKKALHDYFGGIHIESKIIMVEKIEKTSMGKKVRVQVVT
jgi:acyl-coenzyme A synthetase/AMP-(fatty) acid ligase